MMFKFFIFNLTLFSTLCVSVFHSSNQRFIASQVMVLLHILCVIVIHLKINFQKRDNTINSIKAILTNSFYNLKKNICSLILHYTII